MVDEDKIKKEFKKYCHNYPYIPSILPKVGRIIVIGDIHGDFQLTINCLKIANLIDNNLNWIGGNTIVVQIGDQIDRCRPNNYKCNNPDSTINDEASDIKILKLFTKLHKQAINYDGAVFSLLGNHELMAIMGNLNYVSYQGLLEFKNYKNKNIDFKKKYNNLSDVEIGRIARQYAFARGNEYAKLLGCTRLSSVIIGNFLFVHAGIIPEFVNKFNITNREDIILLNNSIRKWILNLINVDYVDKIVNSYDYSMFWNRILGNIPPNVNNNDPKCIKYLNPVLNLFKVGNMIIGHTPQFFSNKVGINTTCGNKLWRVDNGASQAFNSFDKQYSETGKIIDLRKAQVLEILNDDYIKILK